MMTHDQNMARAAFPYLHARLKRNVGDFVSSGNWNGYWETTIGTAEKGTVLVRGYPIHEIIEKLSHTEAVFLVVRGRLPSEIETKVLDICLRATLEHGFVTTQTCSAVFVASAAPESPASAMAAGVLARGSHTGSPQKIAEMLIDICDQTPESEQQGRVEEMIRLTTAHGLQIPGLGHPMHKGVRREPRAKAVYEAVMRVGGDNKYSRMMDNIQASFTRITGNCLPINVEGELAPTMLSLGFNPVEMVGLCCMAFMPGIISHINEEVERGVPLRFIPDARYTGEPLRHIDRDPLA